MAVDNLSGTVEDLRRNLNHVILGKHEVVDKLLVALFAGGNVLLEDVPGVGKTTLAKALARSLRAEYRRIQFTPDLLPADILGTSIFHPQTGEFSFRKGPVFANIVLADEINRASPRTQSALLEAMTEFQVTIDGECHALPLPFMVVATENPVEFHGTYPLPESQIDRFMLRLELGYPDEATELEMLRAQELAHPLDSLEPVTDVSTLMMIQDRVRRVGVEDGVANYLLQLCRATRSGAVFRLGSSPRASLMFYRAAQATAFMKGRDFVTPDDVRELAVPVLAHRVVPEGRLGRNIQDCGQAITDIVERTPVPV